MIASKRPKKELFFEHKYSEKQQETKLGWPDVAKSMRGWDRQPRGLGTET